jgi:chromosome segregation ATPase
VIVATRDIKTKLAFDGEQEYKDACKEINTNLNTLGTEMQKVTAEYANNDKSVDGLTKKQDVLKRTFDEQAKKVEENEKALAALKEEGTASADTIARFEQALNKSQAELYKTGNELEKTENALSDAGNEAGGFSDEMENAGKETEESGKKFEKVGEVLKVVGAAMAAGMAAIGAAAVTVGKEMYEMATDASAAGDKIDKSSQRLGMSREAYQEWSYILDQNGASIDSLGAGMKTLTQALNGVDESGVDFLGNTQKLSAELNDQEQILANMVRKGISPTSDEYKTLEKSISDTQKELEKNEKEYQKQMKAFEDIGLSIEDVKNKNPEEAFALVITALQDMPEGAEKTTAAMKLLGKQGMALAPLLNETAEETERLRNYAHTLGAVMSDDAVNASVNYSNSLTDLNTAMQGVKKYHRL